MKVLADTHAFVWFALADPALAATARSVLEDPANEILISPASYWEVAIKVHLGKWQLAQPYSVLIDSLWTTYGFQRLPIAPSHTARLIGLPNHHGDPFDRLLIAQSLVENIGIISSDSTFDLYGVSRVWN